MRVGRGLKAFGLCAAVLLTVGCKQHAAVQQISLARWGGKLTLRLNLQKGDKFTYVRGTEGDRSTQAVTQQVEVVNVEGHEYRMLATIVDVDVSGEGLTAGRRKRFAKRMKKIRIEGIYDEYSSTKKLNAATEDEEIRQEIGMIQAFSPGLMGIVFPKEPVGIGDQWHVNLDFAALSEFLGGGMEFDQGESVAPLVFTLKGAEDDGTRTMAVIDYEFNSRFRLHNLLTELAGAMGHGGDSTAAISIVGKGTMRVDTNTGLVVRDEAQAQVSLELGKEKRSTSSHDTLELKELDRLSGNGGVLSTPIK